jgi:hypothetical protein
VWLSGGQRPSVAEAAACLSCDDCRQARNAKERRRQSAGGVAQSFTHSAGRHVSDIRSYQRESVVRARLRPSRHHTPVAITTPAGPGACRSAIERGLTGRPASCPPRSQPYEGRSWYFSDSRFWDRSGIWPSRPSAAPPSGLPSNSPACLSRWRSPDMIVSGSGARQDGDKSNLYPIAS